MATYTITVNERTNGGKALMAYLRDLGVLVEKRSTVRRRSSYMRSKEDVRNGRVETFSNSEDLFQSLGI